VAHRAIQIKLLHSKGKLLLLITNIRLGLKWSNKQLNTLVIFSKLLKEKCI
jgi:hypothetical protein